MGWICPSCGSENPFETKVCRACRHKATPGRLAEERMATVRDRLRANRFDFLGQSPEGCAWIWVEQASSIWRRMLPYALAVAVVLTATVPPLSGAPGPLTGFYRCLNAVFAAFQIFEDRVEPAGERLLYGWLPEEERVIAVLNEFDAFTESASDRTGELAWQARDNWSAAGKAVATLRPRLPAKFYLERVTNRMKWSRALFQEGWQLPELCTETRKQAGNRLAQYQKTFIRRVQEIRMKIKSRLQSLSEK